MKYKVRIDEKTLCADITRGRYTVAVVWSGDKVPTIEKVKANAQRIARLLNQDEKNK